MGKKCAFGLGPYSRPRAQFFPHTNRPSPINNMFIFSCSKLVLQSTNGFVYATIVIESACAPSTNDS